MRRHDSRAFPGHAIRGEELLRRERRVHLVSTERRTKVSSPGILVRIVDRVLQGGRAVLGVIEAPALEERWWVARVVHALQRQAGEDRDCRETGRPSSTDTAEDFDPGERRRFEALSARAALRSLWRGWYLYGMLAGGTVTWSSRLH